MVVNIINEWSFLVTSSEMIRSRYSLKSKVFKCYNNFDIRMSYQMEYHTTMFMNLNCYSFEDQCDEKLKDSENYDSTESSDNQNIDEVRIIDTEDDKPIIRQEPIQNHSKVKSELCRKFMEYGYCPYQDKCTFAHGPSELRQNQTPNNLYKTKKCFAFFGGGFCKYGERCNYLHTRTIEDLPKTEEYNRRKWREILKINRDVVYNSRPSSKLAKLLRIECC